MGTIVKVLSSILVLLLLAVPTSPYEPECRVDCCGACNLNIYHSCDSCDQFVVCYKKVHSTYRCSKGWYFNGKDCVQGNMTHTCPFPIKNDNSLYPESCGHHMNNADIAFIIDETPSVGKENFHKTKRLVKEVVNRINYNLTQTRVAVTTWSGKPKLIAAREQYPKKNKLFCTLNDVKYPHGNKYTHDVKYAPARVTRGILFHELHKPQGLNDTGGEDVRTANQTHYERNSTRLSNYTSHPHHEAGMLDASLRFFIQKKVLKLCRHVPRIAVLIMDKKSTKPASVRALTRQLKNTGIRFIVVAVRRSKFLTNEAVTISGSRRRVLLLNSLAQIDSKPVIEALMRIICGAANEGNEAPTEEIKPSPKIKKPRKKPPVKVVKPPPKKPPVKMKKLPPKKPPVKVVKPPPKKPPVKVVKPPPKKPPVKIKKPPPKRRPPKKKKKRPPRKKKKRPPKKRKKRPPKKRKKRPPKKRKKRPPKKRKKRPPKKRKKRPPKKKKKRPPKKRKKRPPKKRKKRPPKKKKIRPPKKRKKRPPKKKKKKPPKKRKKRPPKKRKKRPPKKKKKRPPKKRKKRPPKKKMKRKKRPKKKRKKKPKKKRKKKPPKKKKKRPPKKKKKPPKKPPIKPPPPPGLMLNLLE